MLEQQMLPSVLLIIKSMGSIAILQLFLNLLAYFYKYQTVFVGKTANWFSYMSIFQVEIIAANLPMFPLHLLTKPIKIYNPTRCYYRQKPTLKTLAPLALTAWDN